MADQVIQLPPQSTGLKVDVTELVVGANTVERERINIADPTSATAIATVTAANALKVDNSAVTQPVSGTVTSNQGTAAAATSKWPIEIVDSAGVNIAAVSAANALKVDGSAVTQPISGTVTANAGTGVLSENLAQWNAVAVSSPIASAPLGTETAPVVRVAQSPRTASDTLTVAGASTAVLLDGLQGAAMRLTFAGTITALDIRAQVSIDGGVNFQDVDVYNISSEVVQLSITVATAADFAIYVPGGASHVRANVVTLTGTAPSVTIAMRATYVPVSRTHTAFDRVPGSSDPAHVAAVGASDGTNTQRLRTATAAPAGTEQGLIVRNVPSGTQTVAGTVTANIGTTGGLALDATVAAVQPRRLQDGAGATLATVTAANALKVDGSAVTQPVSIAAAVDVSDRAARLVGQVEGRAAHNTALAGNPERIGVQGNSTQQAAVTTGNTTNLVANLHGELRVARGAPSATVTTSVNTPAANTRATTSIAAGAAGVRHVCRGITATFAAGATAPAAIQLTVALRDGASGAGTIKWQATLALPATAGAMAGITRSDVWIPGTAATAMTLEFSIAGGANTFESVSLEAEDITE